MSELLFAASAASVVGSLGPLGVGWIWDRTLRARGVAPPSFGMLYWLGLISLGGIVLLAYALRLPKAFVLVAASSVSFAGWVWCVAPRFLSGGARIPTASVRAIAPFLPLVLAGVAYCVLDPVRVWDAQLIWLARVRL